MCSSPFDERLARAELRDLLGLRFSHEGFDMGQDVHGNRLRRSSKFLEPEKGQEMSGREKCLSRGSIGVFLLFSLWCDPSNKMHLGLSGLGCTSFS